jgi:RNA polymerase sigma factor (sigma-70 family)
MVRAEVPWRDLIARIIGSVRLLAIRYRNVGIESDDLMQETLEALIRRPNFWELSLDAQARYARAVAAGIASNARRAQLRRFLRERFSMAHESSWVAAADELLDALQDRRTLFLSMRSLPEHLQTALTLHWLEERSAGDIAFSQNLPIGTVKSRLRRARAVLLTELSTHARRTSGIIDSSNTKSEAVRAVIRQDPGRYGCASSSALHCLSPSQRFSVPAASKIRHHPE